MGYLIYTICNIAVIIWLFTENFFLRKQVDYERGRTEYYKQLFEEINKENKSKNHDRRNINNYFKVTKRQTGEPTTPHNPTGE